MRFEFSHAIAAEAAEVARALLDEGFQSSLRTVGDLKEREVLSQEQRTDGTVLRQVRCVLDLDISGPAKRFIGDADPAWIQHEVWDPVAGSWTWHIDPEVGADLLKANGRVTLEAKGGETVRTVTGDVKVGVPLYGGKVEGWIVKGLERAYEEEADLLAKWLGRGAA